MLDIGILVVVAGLVLELVLAVEFHSTFDVEHSDQLQEIAGSDLLELAFVAYFHIDYNDPYSYLAAVRIQ